MRAGISYETAQVLPIEVAAEVIKQQQNDTVEQWRQTRWLATVVANIAGSKVEPQQLMKLPGDKTTRIDTETLRRLSKQDGKL